MKLRMGRFGVQRVLDRLINNYWCRGMAYTVVGMEGVPLMRTREGELLGIRKGVAALAHHGAWVPVWSGLR